jgi:hypothetical protein
MREELTAEDYAYSTKIGVVLGFLTGWAIGVALLVFLQSDRLNLWPWVASIPIWNGIGWALYGFIGGGSGVFAHLGRRAAKPKVDRSVETPIEAMPHRAA